MDLLGLIGIIYFAGLIVIPLLIRWLPGLNEYLHENVNTPNPAVVATIVWPIMTVVLSIYHTIKLLIAITNWASGNGFITKSNKNYKEGGLQ
jgi:hypothetical protein